MTEPSPFQQYRAQRTKGRRPRFTREVARQRTLERTRRHAEAQRRARIVLQHRHPDEYRDLYDAEKSAIEAERGPLPGDEVT